MGVLTSPHYQLLAGTTPCLHFVPSVFFVFGVFAGRQCDCEDIKNMFLSEANQIQRNKDAASRCPLGNVTNYDDGRHKNKAQHDDRHESKTQLKITNIQVQSIKVQECGSYGSQKGGAYQVSDGCGGGRSVGGCGGGSGGGGGGCTGGGVSGSDG